MTLCPRFVSDLPKTKFLEFRAKKNLIFELNFEKNHEFRCDFDGFGSFFQKSGSESPCANFEIGHSEP